MLKPFSLRKYILLSLILLCFGSVGCNADDEFNSEEAMDQKILAADKEPISVETEATQDTSWIDPRFLAEGYFESPMPVLDSVDEVSLTPEQEERAIGQAGEKEKYTKSPRKPKTTPPKE